MPFDEGTRGDSPRTRRRKRVAARRTTPQPDPGIRDSGRPSVGRVVIPAKPVAPLPNPGRDIAEQTIAAHDRPVQSPDTRERARNVRIRNFRRGAAPSGGPGLREVRKAVDLAKRVENGKADLRTLQRHLRRNGYDLKVDGVWGPETERAYREFSGVLSDIGERRAQGAAQAVTQGIIDPDKELERAALGGNAFGYDTARTGIRQDLMRQIGREEAIKEWVGPAEMQRNPLTGEEWITFRNTRQRYNEGTDLGAAVGSGVTRILEQIPLSLRSTPRGPQPSYTAEDMRQAFSKMGQQQMAWAAGIGMDFRAYLNEREQQGSYMGMGVPTPKFMQNLVGGIVTTALGLPGGLIYGVTDPRSMAKETIAQYGWQYGPLFEGDFDTFFKRLEEEPLGPVLDLLAVATVGTAGWARTLGTRVQKTPRVLHAAGGEVRQRRARSELMSRVQNAYDRYSEAYPDMPLIGALSRAARAVNSDVEMAKGELMLGSAPFREAIRKAGFTSRRGEKAALFQRRLIYGVHWPDAVRGEIEMRQRRIDNPETPQKERRRQQRMIGTLRDVLKYEGRIPAKMEEMIREGIDLSRASEAVRIAAGALDPETADYRRNLALRIVYNPDNVDHPHRADLEWLLSHHFSEGETALHMHIIDMMAHSWTTAKPGRTPEQFYANHLQAIDRNSDPNVLPGTKVELPPGVRIERPEEVEILWQRAQRSYDTFIKRLTREAYGPDVKVTPGRIRETEKWIERTPEHPAYARWEELASALNDSPDPNELFQTVEPLRDLINDVKEPDGGFTVDPKTFRPDNKPEGFVVAYGAYERKVPADAITEDDLIGYIRDHQEVFDSDKSARLGGWHNPGDGQVYIDVTRIVNDRAEAESFMREQGQLSMLDREAAFGRDDWDNAFVSSGLTPEAADEIKAGHRADWVVRSGARDTPEVLRQGADDFARDAAEEIAAWRAFGRDIKENLPESEWPEWVKRLDVERPGPVSMRPGEPKRPTMRRLPDETDEQFASRGAAAEADYLQRRKAWQDSDPDTGESDLTIPDDWLAQGMELDQGGVTQSVNYVRSLIKDPEVRRVYEKALRENSLFQEERALFAAMRVADPVLARELLTLVKRSPLFQRSAKTSLSVEKAETVTRAAIAFNQSDAGRMFLGPLADMSSPPHEIAHQLRRVAADIVGEPLFDNLEKEIGDLVGVPIVNGRWREEHEETFAKMAERWLREGKAPSHHSWDVFRALSEALAAVYPRVPRTMPPVTPGARRVFERSFDPGSGLQGEDNVYVPDVNAVGVNRGVGRSRSTLARKPKDEFGTGKKNTGRAFTEGRTVGGPLVVLRDFERTVKAQTKVLSISKLKQFSRPWDYEREPIPQGYSPIVFKPGEKQKMPRVYREEADFAERQPNEYGRMMKEEEIATLGEHFPTEEEVRAGGVPDGAEVYLIPTKIKDAYVGGSLKAPADANVLLSYLKTGLDYTNAATKAALVYGKLSYIPVNFGGNLLFLTIHSGAFAAPALVRASKTLGGLEPDMLARMDFWVGEGQYAKLASERGGRFLEAIHTLATFQSKVADRLPRRAAFIYSAGKRGYVSKGELRALLEDPEHRADLEAIADEARQAMVDFEGMTQFEQEVVSRMVFIYGWIRGATKYGKHLATEMPARASLLEAIGQAGAEWTEEKLGKLEDYLRGIVPFGKEFEKLGVKAISVRNLRAINPISTAAETVEAIFNLQPTADPDQQGTQAIDYLTPPLSMGLEYLTGYDFFFGEKHKQRIDALKGPARWPLVKLGKELIDPTVAAGDISDTPAAQRKNYIPATNSWDARMQALEENVLGGVASKDLDVEAVKARADEKTPKSYRASFLADAEKAGIRPSATALEQADLFDELSEDKRMRRGAPSKDKAIALAEAYAKQTGYQGVVEEARRIDSEAAADKYIELYGKALFGELRKYENLTDRILDQQEG